LVLTRPEVIDVRALVTVAEVTTSIRTIAAEVDFEHEDAGLDRPSVINCDGPHTITKTSLTTYTGFRERRDDGASLCCNRLRPGLLTEWAILADRLLREIRWPG
jgi:mRNA-degrading endonuclease toxin of MazEF toxin-antitoxin module